MEETQKKRKILLVDDEEPILFMFSTLLSRKYLVDTARGGPEALEMSQRDGPYAVVMADMRMPGMSGVELLMQLKEQAPDTIRVLVTGLAERQVAIDAVNRAQVFRIISKPCTPRDLDDGVADAVRQHELIVAGKALLQQTINGEIQALTEIFSRVSPGSFGRAQIIRHGMRRLASYFDVVDTWELEVVAMVARVGEVALPGGVLAKVVGGTELSRDERDAWTRVPEIGSKLLGHIPRLQGVAKAVLYQAKRFDGSGFPGDLVEGKGIPLTARLLKGMTDYQIALEAGEKPPGALRQLKLHGNAYDPDVISAIEQGIVESSGNGRDAGTRVASKLRDLRVGQRLAEPIVTLDETLIVQRGLVITEPMLDRIRNFDIQIGLRQPIYVEDTRLGLPPL